LESITIGSRGAAVEDVQRRLRLLGFDLGHKGIDGIYLEETAGAVRAFRHAEDLPEGDTVDDACWVALVDATFPLGDRTLYLRVPYFHGNDVRQLQDALNVLGFTCGDSDGIFGAHTERALREFQVNTGIDSDGIAGSLTFEAIQRLHHVWEGKDASPHSAAQIGYSRAAEVLEQTEVCFFGTDTASCGIASRISNLALATTPDSRVTSADSIGGAPPKSMLLIQLSIQGEEGMRGIPFVTFSDMDTLPLRIHTASQSAKGLPLRIAVDIPQDIFVDITNPTIREQQHVAVTLLDAFCAAFA
jgi:peptidoglycan hydrolase-like protein with peptidoglycan-binding domain